MKTLSIRPEQFARLAGALQIAAERYRDNAKEFAKLVDYKPTPDSFVQIHGQQAQNIVDDFTRQAEEASAFVALFNASEEITVKFDPDGLDADDEEALKPHWPILRKSA